MSEGICAEIRPAEVESKGIAILPTRTQEPPSRVGVGSVLAVAGIARLAPLMLMNEPGFKALVGVVALVTPPELAICGCVVELVGVSGSTLNPDSVSA